MGDGDARWSTTGGRPEWIYAIPDTVNYEILKEACEYAKNM